LKTHQTITPYNDPEKGKKKQVAEMFDHISGKYDFLNHFLSMNIDKRWRRKSIALLKPVSPDYVLDVATGTGDFAIELYRGLNPTKIIGIDISEGMLEVGRKKIEGLGLSDRIEFRKGDSEQIEFPDFSFDAVTVAFGVRNFENLELGLKEMHRVLKPGGEAIILEFSTPERFPIKQFYRFYSRTMLPILGRIFSKDKYAYTYLPESVKAFPYGVEFESILTKVGFGNVSSKRFSFGISTVYHAKKYDDDRIG
jgi:demethylmenaquinone methyltransferase/2-methoxy-6-polyprenyl-1,4-benzoquinol methylase